MTKSNVVVVDLERAYQRRDAAFSRRAAEFEKNQAKKSLKLILTVVLTYIAVVSAGISILYFAGAF